MKYSNINKKESNPINETSSIYTSDNYLVVTSVVM